MQTRIGETVSPKTLKESMVTLPKSLYSSKISGFDIELDNSCYVEDSLSNPNEYLAEMWHHQHPLIHTWLVLSSISICFLSALLFVIH